MLLRATRSHAKCEPSYGLVTAITETDEHLTVDVDDWTIEQLGDENYFLTVTQQKNGVIRIRINERFND